MRLRRFIVGGRACQIEDNIDYQGYCSGCLICIRIVGLCKNPAIVQSYGAKLRDAIKPSMRYSTHPLPNKAESRPYFWTFYDNPWAYVWLPLCELISRTEVELVVYHHGESIDRNTSCQNGLCMYGSLYKG